MSFCYKDVEQAYARIKDFIVETPLEESYYLGGNGKKVYFKLESLQRAKSFKIRGALNKIMTLTEEEKKRGVVAISSGNHGSSVGYAASLLGIKNAKVIVPKTAPKSKIFKIEYFGAKAMQMGNNYDEAHALGMEFIKKNNMTIIDGFDNDPMVYAGQGTIAIEILKQNPAVDTIIVPIGGGGMITGIAVAAKALKPGIRVIGVQTKACPAMINSYRDNVLYSEYPSGESLCDALIGGIGRLSYKMAKDYVDDFIAVSEENIGKAVSFMAKQEKYVVEGGSCTTVAAIFEHEERIGGEHIALVLSGGNIDGEVLASLLEKY